MIAYLDTNVFDHLYKKVRCTSADIADLRKAIYGRDLSIALGIHILEEMLLNRRASPQELVARVKLTLSLASIRRMVKPCDQLIGDDIRSYAANGAPARPFVDVQIQNAITQGIAELIESDGEEFSEEIAEALADTKRRKERFVQGMNATLREVLLSVEKVPADIFFDDYFRLTAPRIAEVFAERTGVLEACRDRGIEGLLEIRSVRTAIVIALSCRYGQTFEGSPLSLADSIDYLHAPAAAATAEVFVSDDSHLRDALARVGLDNFRVMSMAEFLTASGTSDAAD
ncbi:MAG: hypothetical protein QOK03_1147 [Candidatus Binataceae bacterium]|jgi:hypothetical protein|nr:hypothetical protein [Candidatus Binataceae bacterium]